MQRASYITKSHATYQCYYFRYDQKTEIVEYKAEDDLTISKKRASVDDDEQPKAKKIKVYCFVY